MREFLPAVAVGQVDVGILERLGGGGGTGQARAVPPRRLAAGAVPEVRGTNVAENLHPSLRRARVGQKIWCDLTLYCELLSNLASKHLSAT